MKRSTWYGALALLAGLPALAAAADGYVTGDITLRAGPDIDYPAIDMIPAGAPIDIEGCTDGWEWCDVVFGSERGWVAGNFIQDEYDEQPVLVPEYGERLGIPIVSFSIVTYWDRYYVDRPFYRDRERWYHRPPPHHAPPPPPRRPGPLPAYRGDQRRDQDHDDGRAAPAPQGMPAHARPQVPVDRDDRPQPPPSPEEQGRPQPPPTAVPPAPHGAPGRVPAHQAPAGTHQGGHPPDRDKDDRHGQ
jgi:uncharacterized protein YraI